MRIISAAIVLAMSAQIGAQPNPAVRAELSEEFLSQTTKAIIARVGTNPDRVVSELDKAVKARVGPFDAPGLLYNTEAVSVGLISPYRAYRTDVRDKLRRMEPTESIEYHKDFVIVVEPLTINSPDISKIIVQRNGVTVEPTTDRFTVHEMTTRMGAKFSVHAGILAFPASAFEPDATVVITLVPENWNRNLVYRFEPKQLARFR